MHKSGFQNCQKSTELDELTINDRYRPLLSLLVASQARDNLVNLKVTVFSLLEAENNITVKTVFEKIDFVISDQTSHNVGIEEIVAENSGTEHIPEHLFCNVHPSLMFNQWSDIENAIRRHKIYSSFLVNVTSSSSWVTEQARDCMTRLINHDFDHKSWTKAGEFHKHIQPRVSKSVALKNERFNHLTLTCAIALYHLDDVASYLVKYDHLTNQMACIVRCFIDLETLNVLYCTGALIGLHFVEPFFSLTTSTNTTYSKPEDLSTMDSNRLLNVHSPALGFVSSRRFQEIRYDEHICSAADAIATELKPEVLKVLLRLLPKLADGFQNQKGVLFGFGNIINESPHALANMDLAKLERAPIQNFDSERILSRRGAKQLKLISSQDKSKLADLIERRKSGAFRQNTKLTKPEGRVPGIFKE
uniref:Uncharacterized protein n=1 Tax=Octopus bimaculoides TaxID=37653 RepID=A0A0L8FLC5_OCTBM